MRGGGRHDDIWDVVVVVGHDEDEDRQTTNDGHRTLAHAGERAHIDTTTATTISLHCVCIFTHFCVCSCSVVQTMPSTISVTGSCTQYR